MSAPDDWSDLAQKARAALEADDWDYVIHGVGEWASDQAEAFVKAATPERILRLLEERTRLEAERDSLQEQVTALMDDADFVKVIVENVELRAEVARLRAERDELAQALGGDRPQTKP